MQKEPRQRLQAIGDWKLLLVETCGTGGPAQTGGSAPLIKAGWIAAAVLAVGFVVAGVGWYRATRPAELKPLVRLDVDLGAGVSLGSITGTGADTILSPDGTRLVYVSQGKLFTRRMDQPKAVELAGTEGAFAPFFSPDGQWVAFFGGGKLQKISVEGGAAVAVCDAPSARGGTWGEDGNIIAALTSTGRGVLSRIPSTGGAPTPLTELAQGEAGHRWPQILPGGKAVLFTSNA
jgi:Tol biopolymer transport system component